MKLSSFFKKKLFWLNSPFSQKHQLTIRILFYSGFLFFLLWLFFWFHFSINFYKDKINYSNNTEKAFQAYGQIPLWHKKIKTKQTIKVGLITDTHLNLPPQMNFETATNIQPGITKFVKTIQGFQPDFIVHLGDIIEGTRCPAWLGEKQIKLIQKELNQVNVPTYWVIGNHDLRSVSTEQFKKIFSLNSLNYVINQGDYRFIFLDGNYNPQGLHRQPKKNKYIRGYLPPTTIEWLKKQLNTRQRVFIFMHQGLFPGKTTPTSEKIIKPIRNAPQIQELLEKYRVDGFFNGHMEVLSYHKKGYTHYYSLTGTVRNPFYTQSFYELTVKEGEPRVIMYYFSYPQNKEIKLEFEKIKSF